MKPTDNRNLGLGGLLGGGGGSWGASRHGQGLLLGGVLGGYGCVVLVGSRALLGDLIGLAIENL